MALTPARLNENLVNKFGKNSENGNYRWMDYNTIYSDVDIFTYLEEMSNSTPLWLDIPRIHFYRQVLGVIKNVDYKNITTEDVFFYSQLNDIDICPHDNEALRKYANENCENIKKNIIVSIISYIQAIACEFNTDNKYYNDLGLSIPLIMEVRDKLIELARSNIKFTKNDLYLKLCTLRDSLKLAHKRYIHIEMDSMETKNIVPYGCIININEVSSGLLKYVLFLDRKQYNLNKEEDLKELSYLCDKDHLKISLLTLECLLLLIDPLKSEKNEKMYHKLSKFIMDTSVYHSGDTTKKILSRSNANSWISSIPSLEPNSVIQVTKVKKFSNIKNVINRGDVFNKKMPTFKYLYNIYNALSNDNQTYSF